MFYVDQPATGALRRAFLRRRFVAALLLAAGLWSFWVPRQAVAAGIPEGVWLIETTTALQVFDCDGLLCGRVAWLRNFRDPTGQIQHDKFNPDPALQQRLLCGLTVFWGLRPDGAGKWIGGWFYNTFVARIYLGIPLFGETRILSRIPRLRSAGWC